LQEHLQASGLHESAWALAKEAGFADLQQQQQQQQRRHSLPATIRVTPAGEQGTAGRRLKVCSALMDGGPRGVGTMTAQASATASAAR
jgi:hypothetical protein